MRLENRSAFHPSPKLFPIIDFVTEHTRFSALATLRVTDRVDGRFSGGMAHKHRRDVSSLSLVVPSLIELQLSPGADYPCTTNYVPEVGSIEVRGWDEEVLLVLGHEAKHVDDFWSESFTDEHKAEISAERFARSLLKKWRKRVSI